MSALPAYLLPIGISILVLGFFIATIILIVEFLRKKSGLDFSVSSVLRIYLYAMSSITLFAAISGSILSAAALFSFAGGYQFSYQVREAQPFGVDNGTPASCFDGELIDIDGSDYCVDVDQRRSDIITGITLFVSMIILFAVHRGAALYLDHHQPAQLLGRIYLFISLSLYSVLGVITIPASIYNTVNYLLLPAENLGSYDSPIPGPSLAAALIIVPLWLIYVFMTVRASRDNA
jgi:hypothetical protein